MNDKLIDTGSQPVVENMGSNNYVEELKNIKENMISRDTYNQVVKERDDLSKALADNVLNGGTFTEEKSDSKEIIDDKALSKELLMENNGIPNLEAAEKMLKLRKAQIEKYGVDPFMPLDMTGKNANESKETAEKFAAALEHCIEIAQGNSDIFTRELDRITIDTGINRYKR